MSLGNEQRAFALHIALLVIWAYREGYEITFGDAYATDGHVKDSFHYKRLAIDLNLFKDGEYLTETEDHADLGEYWKSLDPENTWGGDFKRKDGNHYSRGEK